MKNELDAQRQWLRYISRATGKAVSVIALDAGLHTSTLTRLMVSDTSRGLRPSSIKKIEEAFPDFPAPGSEGVLDRTANIVNVSHLDTISVIGTVEAGVWREAALWEGGANMYDISIPPNLAVGAAKFALEVRGQSMNRVYPEGTILICIKSIEAGREPKENERVVVERTKNGFVEATVKQWRGGRLWPESSDPDHQEPLEVTPVSELSHEEVRIIGYVIGSYRPE